MVFEEEIITISKAIVAIIDAITPSSITTTIAIS